MNTMRLLGIATPITGVGRSICVLLLGLNCYSCAQRNGADTDITGKQLIEKLESGWKPAIVDVRSGREYTAGHVPDAIHLSFWNPLFSSDSLNVDKERPVVVYCEHGPRAYIAAYGLRNKGFKQVYYLTGHMSQWRKDGLPIEIPPQVP